jgi:hypothetical protein
MAARFHGVSRSSFRAALIVLLGSWSACIVGDQRCGENQIEIQGSFRFCACKPGTVANASGIGCVRCGKHEKVESETCVCAAGYTRATADAPCAKTAIDQPCEVDGSCDAGCTANADCTTGWSCEVDAGTHFCKQPPTGQGAHCDTSADCAGNEATFCENLQSHTCLLEKCATHENVCPNEWSCCDLTSLIGASLCVPPERLVDGACPAGGKMVP